MAVPQWHFPADVETDEARPSSAAQQGPTPQEITALKAAIQNAKTLEEVAELEKALVTGNVPSQFQVCLLFHGELGRVYEVPGMLKAFLPI